MRSWFTFERDRGICILDNSFSQDVDVSKHIPSIKGPDGHFNTLLFALQDGGHWISLEDTSDLPFIGIMDKELLSNEKNPSANDDLLEHLVVVGQEPIYFDNPIEHPLIFPCLSRWFLGQNGTEDLYDIGGESSSFPELSPENNAFSFRVYIKASKQKSTVKTNNPNIARFKNTVNIVHDLNDSATIRYFLLPAFCVGKRKKTKAANGALTGAPTVGRWEFQAFHNSRALRWATVDIGDVDLADMLNLSLGNKVKLMVDLQSEGSADGQVNALSFVELGSE